MLEALGGYLLLGAKLLDPLPRNATPYCEAFNFGPKLQSNKKVSELVEKIISCWGNGAWRDLSSSPSVHEASLLSISIDKAYHLLEWSPKLDFDETIRQTVDWYKNQEQDPASIRKFTLGQICRYQDSDAYPVKIAAEKMTPCEN